MKALLPGIYTLLIVAFMVSIPQVFAQAGTPYSPDIEQIFQARCVKCHSGPRPPEGLHLDTYGNVMAGAKGGPVIVPGHPDKSQLLKSIKGISKPRMPKDGPPWLSEKEIALIENWIATGASDMEARK